MCVQYRNQLQFISSNPIRNHVRRIRDNQFSRAWNAPWSPHVRLRLEQLNRVQYTLGHKRCSLLGVFGDESSERDQVLQSPARPDDLHRGAFVSPFLPQLFSHLETASWLTNCSDSRSSIPA